MYGHDFGPSHCSAFKGRAGLDQERAWRLIT